MNIKNNITKLYIITALESTVLYYAFDKIFMQIRGLSISEIIYIEVIYGALVILLEVPSGALSDRWSRKKVLALNSLFLVLNTVVWAVSQDFRLFAIGVAMGAVHSVLRSGTNSSIMYDSLKEIGKEYEYEKCLGRRRAIAGVAFMISALVGGIVADNFGIEAAFWLSVPSVLTGGLISLTLVEPKFHRSTEEVSYWQHIKVTAKFLKSNTKFIHIFALISTVMTVQLILAEYSQLYIAYVGFGVFVMGILASLTGLKETIMNLISHKVGQLVENNLLYGLLLVVMSLSLLLACLFTNWFGILNLFIATSPFHIIDVVSMADFNKQVPSKIRATSESFISLLTSTVHLPVVLLFAYIGQNYSIITGFGLLCILVSSYTVIYWLSSYKALKAS